MCQRHFWGQWQNVPETFWGDERPYSCGTYSGTYSGSVQQDFSETDQCRGPDSDLLSCSIDNGDLRVLPVEIYARAYLGPVFTAFETSMGLISVYDETDEDMGVKFKRHRLHN